MANETPAGEPTVAAIVEMLRREMDASKSVSDHVQFLRQVAADGSLTGELRDHLVSHIGEEEQEHQDHLARLLPALEQLTARLAAQGDAKKNKAKAAIAPQATAAPAVPESQLTLGSLVGKRPWHVGAPRA